MWHCQLLENADCGESNRWNGHVGYSKWGYDDDCFQRANGKAARYLHELLS